MQKTQAQKQTLIIAEKPNSARKIAEALAEGGVKQVKTGKQACYYELERHGKKITVAPAVGHLYGLKPLKPGYPVLEAEWRPTSEDNKVMAYSKQYLDAIKKLAKTSDSFVGATDYDVEGEVILANVLEFACGVKNAKRMKFSTLTKEELQNAFEHAAPSIDEGMRDAGRTRHYLDLAWGLTLSRALMHAIKTAGTFRIMSIGRVQGPTLALLAQRELKIRAFVSEPYWQLVALYKGVLFYHDTPRFFNEKEADEALKQSSRDGTAASIKKKMIEEQPPAPFDLTTMQMEAYHAFNFSPTKTLQIAQSLYEHAVASYPRTSSQKLPEQLNLQKIIRDLSAQKDYSNLASALIAAKSFKPREGKKEDSAHPAIHPTGLKPEQLTPDEAKLYDLLVKRFLACFAPNALIEEAGVQLLLGTQKYFASGKIVKKKGWMDFYTYAKLEEKEMPDLREGQKITVEKIEKLQKDTQPPKRFTAASVIKALEEKNLGTKATRAEIIETLYGRNYIAEKSIEVTPLGMSVFESLEKHVPEIMSESLTRHFEKQMVEIEQKRVTPKQVEAEGKEKLVKIVKKFDKDAVEIGKELLVAVNATQRQASVLGKCSVCKEGDIVIKKSRYGLFAACARYPDCKTTFSLPKNALVKPAGKQCEHCNAPVVTVIRRGKRPFNMCLTKDCVSKADWGKGKRFKKSGETEGEDENSESESKNS
ncbi:DNA topoisomerase I [Candidatus Micrarchaeota archaeon]|nr:DNA topoisomerase I [Candidatus Micrarchaeota archaeon]